MRNGRARRTQGVQLVFYWIERVTRGFKDGDRLLNGTRPAALGVETGGLRVKHGAPCLSPALLGAFLSSDPRAPSFSKLKLFASVHVRSWPLHSGVDCSKFKNATRPLYCCGWSANSHCRKPGVRPGESLAMMALAWVEISWRVAFVCGQEFVGLHTNVRGALRFGNVFAG